MSPAQINLLFWMGLLLTVIGVVAIFIIEVEMSDFDLYISKTILYLSGLGTLFCGWKKIEHKFPGKKD
ncbi:hypothetical protein [Roseivirga misakiensis]|uniref:Uncharacterized protein n=1 Tax=Roseivirga misakiensis TaxID=1563681 RepID=A0A1E5T500_9BACT|nr:hypothetical protein [Roseivirga misakiensis]OEK06436.1 hypothetical protein BFP71_01800 [Roseivirga misakiensis]